MKKTTTVIMIMTVMSLLIFSGCKRHGHDNDRSTLALDYLSETLDLTEEQQTMLDRYKTEIKTKAESHKEDKDQVYAMIKTQIAADKMDLELITEEAEIHKQHMDEIMDMVIARVVEFHQTLSAEQKTKLLKKMEKFKKFHAE